MMLRLYGRGNFTLESEMARRNFEAQATEKLLAVKSILPHMDQMLWRCDPNVQNEHLTYEKLTMLQVKVEVTYPIFKTDKTVAHCFQGHIENEVDMNDLSSCRHSCSSYSVSEPKG